MMFVSGEDLRRTNTELLFREETRGRQPDEKGLCDEGMKSALHFGKETARPRVGRLSLSRMTLWKNDEPYLMIVYPTSVHS